MEELNVWKETKRKWQRGKSNVAKTQIQWVSINIVLPFFLYKHFKRFLYSQDI